MLAHNPLLAQAFERLMSERRRAIEAQFRARPPSSVSTRKGARSGPHDTKRGRWDDVGSESVGSPLAMPQAYVGTPGSCAHGPFVQVPASSARSRTPPRVHQNAAQLLDADADAADAWAQLINAATAADVRDGVQDI